MIALIVKIVLRVKIYTLSVIVLVVLVVLIVKIFTALSRARSARIADPPPRVFPTSRQGRCVVGPTQFPAQREKPSFHSQ